MTSTKYLIYFITPDGCLRATTCPHFVSYVRGPPASYVRKRLILLLTIRGPLDGANRQKLLNSSTRWHVSKLSNLLVGPKVALEGIKANEVVQEARTKRQDRRPSEANTETHPVARGRGRYFVEDIQEQTREQSYSCDRHPHDEADCLHDSTE